MLKNEIKNKLFLPFNFLFPFLLFMSWYLGTQNIRSNYEFLESAIQRSDSQARNMFLEKLENFSGFTVFAEGISGFYLSVMIVVLVGLSFSSTFAYDKNTGFGNLLITRKGFNKYFFCKIASIFLVNFFIVFATLAMILILCLVKYSASSPEYTYQFIMVSNSPLATLFINHPTLSCILMIFNLSFFSCIYTLLGLGISLFTTNRFLISLSPLCIYIVFTLIPQLFSINSPISKLFAWFFPNYLTGWFTNGDIWYSDLSPYMVLIIHFLVIIAPTIIILFCLYYTNKIQYIK